MPIDRVQKEVGGGITARSLDYDQLTWRSAADSDAFSAAVARRNASLETPWGLNEAVLDDAAARLTEIEGDVAQRLIDDPKAYYALFVERESPAWYYRAIVVQRMIAESAARDGQVFVAMQSALQIGELITELRMKFDWELDALGGRKSREGGTYAGKARGEMNKSRDAQIRLAYLEKIERGVKPATAKASLAKIYGFKDPARIRQILRAKIKTKGTGQISVQDK